MRISFPVRNPGRKLWFLLALLGMFVVVAAACSSNSSGDRTTDKPPAAASSTQPTPDFTGASETTPAEPTAEPTTGQPEPSDSESTDDSARPGKVVAAFEDGPQGPFLVLTPLDEDQGDLEYATSHKDSLRNLDVTALPISMVWKVDVSTDVLRACRPNTVRMVFKEYPSCAGSSDATPSSTDR